MRNNRISSIACMLALGLACVPAHAQNNGEINDMTTPLHLLKPEYKVPYGELTVEEVKASIDRVFAYIESNTPVKVFDKDGKEVKNYKKIPHGATLDRGAFRIGSYEWGVTYQALLSAAEATGDKKYKEYVDRRFKFLAEVAPGFRKLYDEYKDTDAQMEQILHPKALDDAGAMCCAMMKAGAADKSLKLDDMIENYFEFIEHGQYRLADGTFARHRPQHNTIWLDDMFMGIPSIAYRDVYKHEESKKYFDEATKIFRQFVERMYVPEKGLYRHGYVEGLHEQPTYHWARANGWAILTNCELLDVLPENHPERAFALEQLRKHVKGLASYQSSEGFWHQLVDKNDSYLETSATAIYVYCIAHAINKGWIDGITYGPVAQLGWHAVNTKITDKGQVDGTCVGTGMAFDPAFYYYRPANYQAAHGYGPVIWAGAEMIRLLNSWYPRTNDSGLHYYKVKQTNPSPLFYLTEDGKGEAVE